MRSYHRWFGAIASLLLAFIALTGIGIQIDLWVTGHPPPGTDEKRPPAPHVALPEPAELERMVDTAASAMRTRHADISAERIEIALVGGRQRITVGAATPFGPHVQIDALTGADMPEARMQRGYHEILQDLHAGYRFGLLGRVLSLLSGLALLVLSVTGVVVYLQLLRRRWRSGRKALFWK